MVGRQAPADRVRLGWVLAALLLGISCASHHDGAGSTARQATEEGSRRPDSDSDGASESLPPSAADSRADAGDAGGSDGEREAGAASDPPLADAGEGADTGVAAAPDAGGASPPAAADAGWDADAASDAAVDPTECCPDGDCVCRGERPAALTATRGPYDTQVYAIPGVGCVRRPTDAGPPFAAVVVAEGFASSGCGSSPTFTYAALLASHGLVTLVVDASGEEATPERGQAITAGVRWLEAENADRSSPLFQQLAGRYGVLGAVLGGGGATHAAAADPRLRANVAIMPWNPTAAPVSVPTLVVCGSHDVTAPCDTHGQPFYARIPSGVPKLRVTVNSGLSQVPAAGSGAAGRAVLGFVKLFVEGDERWRPLLEAVEHDDADF